jgi:hypothetical protein
MFPTTDTLMQIFTEERWYDELELVTHLDLAFTSYQIQKVLSMLNFLVGKKRLAKTRKDGHWYYRKIG